ncbi:MAG: hypothetical protein KDD58_15985, partial [Bdellovibrionales bacterium]|nr:hypothetical protein [Bdellovibrionales bacterium]
MKKIFFVLFLILFSNFGLAKSTYKTLPPENIKFKIEIEKLVSQQKYNEALKFTEEYIKKQKNKNDIEYARAIIKKVQLQLGLHGYETAVKELKASPLPIDPMARALVELYYAFALMKYYQSYSWEINKREKVVSTEEIDLIKWTKDQINEEINNTFDK